MKSSETGLTLVELLVATLLVGVLAAFAVPVYRDHVAKARISEAVAMAQPVRLTAAQICGINALGGATAVQLGAGTPEDFATDKVVASISVSDVSASGLLVTVVFKKFGDVEAGHTLVYKGVCANSTMAWSVDPSSTAPAKLLPKQA